MTDFGKGYATCLIQFVFHEPNLDVTVERYAELQKGHPDLFSEAHACEIWANGSTDHLYDMVFPRRLARAEKAEAKYIQARGLDVGHGFRQNDATAAEMHELCDRSRALIRSAGQKFGLEVGEDYDIAFTLDEALGLTPLDGEWACKAPQKRS